VVARLNTSGCVELFGVDESSWRGDTPANKEDVMLTLCIRYTLDGAKLADFEAYARSVAGPIERCGGKVVGYFAPTKFAGPTNVGLSLIDFPSLAAYERYREALAADSEHAEVARRAAQSGVILVEDRSFMQRMS
jgi:NIPSNAP